MLLELSVLVFFQRVVVLLFQKNYEVAMMVTMLQHYEEVKLKAVCVVGLTLAVLVEEVLEVVLLALVEVVGETFLVVAVVAVAVSAAAVAVSVLPKA